MLVIYVKYIVYVPFAHVFCESNFQKGYGQMTLKDAR